MTALDKIEVKEGVDQDTVDAVTALSGNYKYGWETEIEMDYAPKGVNPDIVRLISSKNEEPAWMTEWRLQAFARWEQMTEPKWAMVNYPEIDFQDIYYYARPKSMAVKPKSLDDVDPNGDADGDGLTNLEEYISGNYAYDDENEFTLDVVGFNESSAVLEFMAIRGRDYTVYVSSNLTDWTPTTFRVPDSAEPNVSYQHYRAQDVRAVRVEVPSLGDEGKLQYFKLLVQ